jgi:glucan 1,3-beta-glucosidase
MSTYDDPDFAAYCATRSENCGDGWGLRVLDSDNILIYGAGLYSFFDNYSTICSNAGNGETCQTQIFGIDTGLGSGYNQEKTGQSEVYVYNLNSIGATSMVDRDGVSLASYADNVNVFPDNIAVFRTDARS